MMRRLAWNQPELGDLVGTMNVNCQIYGTDPIASASTCERTGHAVISFPTAWLRPRESRRPGMVAGTPARMAGYFFLPETAFLSAMA